MPIEFHCEHCHKMIRAADEHAGKRAKCPTCHQSVYVPTPDDQIEPLGLEPLDKDFTERQKKLIQETRDLTHKLLHERETDAGAANPQRHTAHADSLPVPDVDVEQLIVQYAIRMADGDLTSSDQLAAEIRRHWTAAEKVLQRLTIDEMPHPSLARIPRPVLVGFFKRLREKK